MLTDVAVEKAWEMLHNVTIPLQPETVSLMDSLHRIAAADVVAAWDLPSCAQSAVDGFVVHKKDLHGGCELLNGKELGSGEIPAYPLTPGNTVKVVTGGVLPEGAAAVIPEELAVLKDNYLILEEEIAPGANVKIQGEDFKEGDLILRRNSRLTPGALGVLAAFGQEKVLVNRRPSVAILCLGPDIIPHHLTPVAGEIRDSNGPILESLVLQDGGQIVGVKYMRGTSTRDSFKQTMEEMFNKADLVITTGGTALGEFDHQALPLLSEMGVNILFWGIQAKPGSHSGGGLWGSKPVLALSGNPSACLVGYHLLVSPVLRQMQGLAFTPEITTAVCIDEYRKSGKTRRFLRGRMFVEEGVGKVKILPGQKSTMLRSLLNYNALIDLQAGHPPVEEESMVSVIPINNAGSIFEF
jgi:molybdopterin molybdotransferase